MLQVVGAGVGRTGTLSLKAGLEQLLGQPCYHMLEVFGHPDHVTQWREAAEGGAVDWATLLDGYGATSDFPACLFWPEILEANPDAIVVLSTRSDERGVVAERQPDDLRHRRSEPASRDGRLVRDVAGRGVGSVHLELDGRRVLAGRVRAPQRRRSSLGAV